MAVIRQLRTNRELVLGPRVLVGRSPACDLVIGDPKVSAEHAVIWWEAGWRIRDLGSRNGTWTEGTAVTAEATVLGRDRPLGFGGVHDPWVLVDDGPPPPSATGPHGTVVGLQDLLLLPSAENPLAMIHLDGQGRWVLEIDGRARPTMSGERVEVGGAWWELALPESLPTTVDARALTLDDVALVYVLSRDQEHVAARLELPTGRRDLGARTYHYAMSVLARVRLEDPETSDAERGWIHQDELVHKLRIEPALLNLHVHRARRQLTDEGVWGGAGIVERRAASGQLRFGTGRVVVEQG